METLELPPHLQRMVNYDINGLDIMHGELKNLMLIWEKELEKAEEPKYAEGFLDALSALYHLTYQLSFAIGERNDK
jgi:glutamine cyclotransferase